MISPSNVMLSTIAIVTLSMCTALLRALERAYAIGELAAVLFTLPAPSQPARTLRPDACSP